MSVSQTLIAERYRLVHPLGHGGMGKVWLARDEVLNRDVAIKEVVFPAALTDAEGDQAQRRTMREARAAARLNHPNVVRMYDVVEAAGRPWIVMEYVPSRSLQDLISSDGPLPPDRVARIGLGVLAALQAAHEAGVMHRDVKPSNVLLTEAGRVVLTDFGLATIEGGDSTVTRPGMILGSPAYIAPERARDGTAGPASDLWSLGATLYAAVEGQSPYERTSAMATLTALATEEPGPATRAGQLGPVLDGLLRKDPETRIAAAQAHRLLWNASAPPDPEPQPAVPGRQRLTRRRRLLAVALVTLVVLGLAVFATVHRGGPMSTAAPRPSGGASASAGPQPSTAAPSTPAAASVPPGANPPALPAGWHFHHDPTGFTVAVPDGWAVSRNGTIVYFRDPTSGRVLGVDQSPNPKWDPVADWTAQEGIRLRRGDWRAYRRIKIAAVRYHLAAADWEFSYASGNGRTHVIDRGFVVSAHQAHAIYWSTPESAWAQNLPNFELITSTFQPIP